MRNVISAIEQELKFMHDSEEGTKQYRKGYTQALEITAEFLRLVDCDFSLNRNNCSALDRLLSSVSLQRHSPLFETQ